jgi:hypothetical protein
MGHLGRSQRDDGLVERLGAPIFTFSSF